MSSNFSVYFGAYLFVPLFATQKTTTAYFCSARCGSKASSHNRFCNSCGSPVVSVDEAADVMKALYCHDLSTRMSERFWTPESAKSGTKGTIWLPNYRGGGMNFSAGDSGFDFSDEYVISETEKAMEYFSPAIEELKTMYNVAAEARFGIIPYYN